MQYEKANTILDPVVSFLFRICYSCDKIDVVDLFLLEYNIIMTNTNTHNPLGHISMVSKRAVLVCLERNDIMWDANIEARLNDLDENGCIKPVKKTAARFTPPPMGDDWAERANAAADRIEALGGTSIAAYFRTLAK